MNKAVEGRGTSVKVRQGHLGEMSKRRVQWRNPGFEKFRVFIRPLYAGGAIAGQ